jgi:hypothetical protein
VIRDGCESYLILVGQVKRHCEVLRGGCEVVLWLEGCDDWGCHVELGLVLIRSVEVLEQPLHIPHPNSHVMDFTFNLIR